MAYALGTSTTMTKYLNYGPEGLYNSRFADASGTIGPMRASTWLTQTSTDPNFPINFAAPAGVRVVALYSKAAHMYPHMWVRAKITNDPTTGGEYFLGIEDDAAMGKLIATWRWAMTAGVARLFISIGQGPMLEPILT